MKRTLHAAALPAMPPLTGEWLEEWLAAAKNLLPGTVRSYAAHIRLYCRPHIGQIRIDRLRVADVASVLDAIDEINDAIIEARASGDTALPATVRGRGVVGAATQAADPRDPPVADHHIYEAASRRAGDQPSGSGRPAARPAAPAAGLDRRAQPAPGRPSSTPA
jgi:hypothetical protein